MGCYSTSKPTMTEKLQSRGLLDQTRVRVSEPSDVLYWCRLFGCTEQQLRAAVYAVGGMVADVRVHFEK